MNAFVLYLLLLKAIVTTFSGLASVPIVRNDLVLHRHVLTDREMNTSLAITRTTPGPMGLYVVSVGYFVDGTPGAIAGWVAMITPALLMIPLLEFVRKKAEHPRFKAVLRCVVFASAGLLLWVTVPLISTRCNTWLLDHRYCVNGVYAGGHKEGRFALDRLERSRYHNAGPLLAHSNRGFRAVSRGTTRCGEFGDGSGSPSR
jgi:chromate transporter